LNNKGISDLANNSEKEIESYLNQLIVKIVVVVVVESFFVLKMVVDRHLPKTISLHRIIRKQIFS
jgi:hypothetical protein